MVTATICRLVRESAIIDSTVAEPLAHQAHPHHKRRANPYWCPAPEALDTKNNCTILIPYTSLELGQRHAHFLLQPGDEAVRLEWQPESSIIGSALLHEVGGQVLVRVAVAVGADDPDVLRAQSLAERFQQADLIGQAIDAGLAAIIRLMLNRISQ